MKNLSNQIYFAKVNESAIIPSKREEDGAFDLYANFKEDYMVIKPHETKMIPTGIASAFSSDYVAILKERGSNGSKGIGQRAGVIDSGFRGEWQVPLTNHNELPVVIIKNSDKYSANHYSYRGKVISTKLYDGIKEFDFEGEVILYPYEKAICQCIMVEVPKLKIEEIAYDELLKFESERGTGMLGSSGK